MNENWTWILWTVLGVVLIIAEVFTPGFVLLWFGVGALAAALAAFLGAGLAAQFLLFIALSSILTALSRTIFANYFTAQGEPEGAIGGPWGGRAGRGGRRRTLRSQRRWPR